MTNILVCSTGFICCMFFMLCLFPIALTTPLGLASSRKHFIDNTYISLFCLHIDRTICKQHLHWPVFLTYKVSLVHCMVYNYYSLSNLVLILCFFPNFLFYFWFRQPRHMKVHMQALHRSIILYNFIALVLVCKRAESMF
jgi:hypothetical protein